MTLKFICYQNLRQCLIRDRENNHLRRKFFCLFYGFVLLLFFFCLVWLFAALLTTKVRDSQKHFDLKCCVNVINKETEIKGNSLEKI